MISETRDISVLLFDDVNLLDVAGPVQAFASANVERERYRLHFRSLDGKDVRTSCGLRLRVDGRLVRRGASDLLVPGGAGVDALRGSPALRARIARWQERDPAQRLIAICSGALVLAEAGVLDGRPATTHWGREAEALACYPDVDWSIGRLFCIDGAVMTSAGVSSGIDLALEIIQRDHGPECALAVARELVVYLKRSGTQAQFAELLSAQFSSDRDTRRLIRLIADAPGRSWTLERMADAVHTTPRTLTRRFRASTGQSPVKFLERYRVKLACDALASGAASTAAADTAGFESFQKMQRAFKRQLGTTVGRYRERFAAGPDGDA